MADQENKDPNQNPSQQGAPQKSQNMPSSGNSPDPTGATLGTDESGGGSQDVERSGMSGTGTRRAPDTGTAANPGGTSGKAEETEPRKEGDE